MFSIWPPVSNPSNPNDDTENSLGPSDTPSWCPSFWDAFDFPEIIVLEDKDCSGHDFESAGSKQGSKENDKNYKNNF